MDNLDKPKRVALYIRVSTEEQSEKYGAKMQLKALEGLVQSKNYKLSKDHIYQDLAESGTVPLEERPAFSKLRSDIMLAGDQKPFDVVAVYKIDRFARKLRLLLEVIDFFEDYDVEFLSCSESIDTSTPFGKAALSIIGVIAELELENIKQRTQDGWERAASEGVQMGAHAKFGYRKNEDKKLEIFEEEASVLKAAYDMLVWKNRTVNQICNHFKETKVLIPSASANKFKGAKNKLKYGPFHWNPNTLKGMLLDDTYIGKAYYQKQKDGVKLPKEEWLEVEFAHEPIIEKSIFEKARQVLTRNKRIQRVHSQSNVHQYSLSGLLKCADCYDPKSDREMYSWTGEKKKMKNGIYTYFYRCGRKKGTNSGIKCGVLQLPESNLEQYFKTFIKDLLANPIDFYKHQAESIPREKEVSIAKKERKKLIEIVNSFELRKKSLLIQHRENYINDKELKKAMDDEKQLLKKANNRLHELDQTINRFSLSEGYLQAFEDFKKQYSKNLDSILTIDRKQTHTLLSSLINEIVVHARPLRKGDVVAGRRTENQRMPYKLEVKLRLPEEIMKDLLRNKVGDTDEMPHVDGDVFKSDDQNHKPVKHNFRVKKSTWSGRRDSNSRPFPWQGNVLAS